MNPETTSTAFADLGLAPRLLEILRKLDFTIPTPIQAKAIPIALDGKDVIGIAQTGTGKTLAFGLPILQRLAAVGGQALIVLPTRELALQVDEVFQRLGRPVHLRTVVLIGGAAMGPQIGKLRQGPHVIICTPGRIIDHLEQKTMTLDKVKILVLDEADRMLDMGFAPQIKKILEKTPSDRQTLLFSATMPQEIVGMARGHMKLPVQVEIARAGTATELVTHELYVLPKEQKVRLLEKLLAEHRGTILVFARTKHGVRKLERQVREMGHSSTSLHSERTLSQRQHALEGFKSGKYRVMVATDIAARGIHVNDIALVINFDLPTQAEDYVHRIGRTGRAGQHGQAISFATPDQRNDVRDIERLIRATLPRREATELPAGRERELPSARPPSDPEYPRRRQQRPNPRRRQYNNRPSQGSRPDPHW